MTQTLLKPSSSCEAEEFEEEMGDNENIEKAMNDDNVEIVNDDLDDGDDGGGGDDDDDSDNGSSDGSDNDDGSVSSESSDDDDSDDSDRGNLSVRFHDDLTTEVYEIPSYTKDLIPDLFYTKDDYARFQSKEQKRYDKRMMKQVQQMVRDAMKDEILEAEANGATPEEIDAMMPQTPEAICELLGSITPKTPTTPNGASNASIIPSCPLFSPPFPVPSPVCAEGDGGGEGRDGDDVRTPASALAADHPDGQEDGEGPKAEKTPSSSSPSPLSSSPSKQRSKVVTERDRIVDNLSDDDLLQFMLGDDDKDNGNETGDNDNDHNGDTGDNDGDTPLNVTVDKDKENNNHQDDENNSKQTDQREKPFVLGDNTNGDDQPQQQQEAPIAPAEEGQEERTDEDSSSGNSAITLKAQIPKSSHEEVSPSVEKEEGEEEEDEEEGGVIAGSYSGKNIVTHWNVSRTPVAAATPTDGDDGGEDGGEGDSLFRRVSIFSDEDFTLNELIHEVPKGADFTHINKNQQLNDLLGTDFSTDVHVEDLVPRSPKNSPKTSPSSRKVHPLPPVPVDLLVRD